MRDRSRLVWIIQEGALYVLLLLLPFSNAAIELSFGFLLVGWLLERLSSGTTRAGGVWTHSSLNTLVKWLAAYLAVCALSIVVSDYPKSSLRALFAKWMEYLGFLVIVAHVVWNRPAAIRRGLIVVACSALLVVIESVAQELFGHGPFRGFPLAYYGRMTGPYRDPIDLATYFMVVIPVLLMFAVTCRRWRRWVLWGLLIMVFGCLARTESLGAWLGLGIGLAVVVMMDRTVRRHALVLCFGAALVGAVYLQRIGRLSEVFSGGDIGKVDRWFMWQAAIRMITDRPILGHGLNTLMANYLRYWVGGERQPRYAHNCYLQVTAETGLIGLVSFVGLLSCLLARLMARRRQVPSQEQRWLLGLSAGLIAFLVQAGIDTNFYVLRQAALFWTLSGLALGLSERLAHAPVIVGGR